MGGQQEQVSERERWVAVLKGQPLPRDWYFSLSHFDSPAAARSYLFLDADAPHRGEEALWDIVEGYAAERAGRIQRP